jgi:hypothetical protein
MGIDARKEESQLAKDYKGLRRDLRNMVNRFGFSEVVKELRSVHEEDEH